MQNGTIVVAVVAALALAASATASPAQEPKGNAAAGQRLAERWCTSCHQPSGNAYATYPNASFAQIARMPSTTALALRAFLRTSHPSMPNIVLTPADTDDLVAYILSLR